MRNAVLVLFCLTASIARAEDPLPVPDEKPAEEPAKTPFEEKTEAKPADETPDQPAPDKGAPPIAAPTIEEGPKKQGPRSWQNADDATLWVARGGLDVCESLTFPLQLIPTVGTLIAIIVEWTCVPPSGLTVEYLQRFHGTHDGRIWKTMIAVAASKLWRDLWRWAGVAAILTAVGSVGLGAAAAWVTTQFAFVPGIAYYAPVAVGGAITLSGFLFVVLRSTRKAGADLVFTYAYKMLTGDFPSTADQEDARRRSPMGPPFNIAERTWLLASTAAGAEPDFRWVHLIPFAGPIFRAKDKVVTLREVMRRMATEDLHEQDRDFRVMDGTIIALCIAEAGMEILGQIALALSAAVFVVGTATTLGWYRNPRDPALAGLVTGATGLAGSMSAAIGILLLVGRELPIMLEPILIPAAYGLWPPRGFFPADHE